jgi:hypothetical protein
MALILAIEPDRRQALKLAMLARNYRHTELVVTDSIGRALAMLDERVPDLILTSFQLQPKHRAALLDRVLEIDADGSRVQTLVIPALGAPGGRASQQSRASNQRGMPASPHGMRGNPSVPNGCDPVVFGRLIAECLGRIPAERRSAPVAQSTRTVLPMSSGPESSEAETHSGRELPTPLPAAASGITSTPEPAPPSRLARPEWRDLLSTIRRDLDDMRADHAESFEETTPTDRTPTDTSAPDPSSTDTTSTETLAPVPKMEGPRRFRRRTAPAQDEWGVFDPQERGLAAMFVNVNEIAKEGKSRTKKTL